MLCDIALSALLCVLVTIVLAIVEKSRNATATNQLPDIRVVVHDEPEEIFKAIGGPMAGEITFRESNLTIRHQQADGFEIAQYHMRIFFEFFRAIPVLRGMTIGPGQAQLANTDTVKHLIKLPTYHTAKEILQTIVHR